MKTLIAGLWLCCALWAGGQSAVVTGEQASTGGGGGGDFTTGLIFDLDPESLSASDGDGIETVSDTSGNAHHFSNATSGSRPIFTNSTSGLNGKKTLWFDGSADHLTNRTYTVAAQNYTYFGVVRFNVAYHNFANGYLLDDTLTTLSIRPHDANVHKLTIYDASAAREFAAISDTQPRLISVVMNSTGTALRVYTNGVSMGSATAWQQPSAGGYLVFGSLANGQTAYFNGTAARQRLYSGALSDANRQTVEDYLGAIYGLTITH